MSPFSHRGAFGSSPFWLSGLRLLPHLWCLPWFLEITGAHRPPRYLAALGGLPVSIPRAGQVSCPTAPGCRAGPSQLLPRLQTCPPRRAHSCRAHGGSTLTVWPSLPSHLGAPGAGRCCGAWPPPVVQAAPPWMSLPVNRTPVSVTWNHRTEAVGEGGSPAPSVMHTGLLGLVAWSGSA